MRGGRPFASLLASACFALVSASFGADLTSPIAKKPIAGVALAPPPVSSSSQGALVLDESSIETLIALAARLAEGDNDASLRQMLAMLQQMKTELRALEQRCAAQRAAGKPCEDEARIHALREQIATHEREVEARTRQDEEERRAQAIADLAKLRVDVDKLGVTLKAPSPLRVKNGLLTSRARVALQSDVARTLAKIDARLGAPEKKTPAPARADAGVVTKPK